MKYHSLVTMQEILDALQRGTLVQYTAAPDADLQEPMANNGSWLDVTEFDRRSLSLRLRQGFRYRIVGVEDGE